MPGLPGVKDQQQQHHVIWILSREKIIEMYGQDVYMKLRVTGVERVVVINLESSNFLNYSGFHWVPPPALSQLEIKTGNLP